MIFIKILHYYSTYAIILHLMYYCGLIDSTYYIAVFTFFGSLFLEYIYPAYMFNVTNKFNIFLFGILIHLIPFLIIPKENAKMSYLVVSLICYLLFLQFDIDNIIKLYNNPEKYIFD